MTIRYLDPEIDARKESIREMLVSEGLLDAARNEGIRQARVDVAGKMIEHGVPIDQIIQITDLTEQEIRKISEGVLL